MDEVGLLVAMLVVVVVGGFCGFVSLLKIVNLKRRVETLEAVRRASDNAAVADTQADDPGTRIATTERFSEAIEPVPQTPTQIPHDTHQALETPELEPLPKAPSADLRSKQKFTKLEALFVGKGLIWIGSLALAFGGFFLARYSLEQGLLPPIVRVGGGVIFGLALLVFAHRMHQRQDTRFTSAVYPPAAIAGAAVITLYGVVYLASAQFSLIGNGFCFFLLSVISFAAAWYALLLGPLLAVIGLLGAYLLPLLIQTSSASIGLLLGYICLVTTASVILQLRVDRSWLWLSTVVAHFLWLGFALFEAPVGEIGIVALGLFYSVLLLQCLPELKQQRRQAFATHDASLSQFRPRRVDGVMVVALLMFAVITLTRELTMWPWLSALLLLIGWLVLREPKNISWYVGVLALWALEINLLPGLQLAAKNTVAYAAEPLWTLQVFVALVAISSGLMSVQLTGRKSIHFVFVAVPALFMTLAYSLQTPEMQDQIYQLILFILVLLAAGTVLALRKSSNAFQSFCYVVGLSFYSTLALTLLLTGGMLTLALLIQLLVMTILSKAFKVDVPQWLYKIIISVCTLRLSAAIWIDDYQLLSQFGMHWSYTIYIPAFLLLIGLRRTLDAAALKNWVEGAAVQVFGCFLIVQLDRMFSVDLFDAQIASYKEAVLLSTTALILAVCYLYRAMLSTATALVYRWYAYALLAIAALIQLVILFAFNPFVSFIAIGGLPLLNGSALAWLLPALLAMTLNRSLVNPKMVLIAKRCAIGFGVLYAVSSIRHLWHSPFITLQLGLPSAENYTYSAILIGAALGLVIASLRLKKPMLQRIGFMILMSGVIKVFVFDLSQLEGVYRIASLMGLGIVMVGLGWLFQRLRLSAESF